MPSIWAQGVVEPHGEIYSPPPPLVSPDAGSLQE